MECKISSLQAYVTRQALAKHARCGMQEEAHHPAAVRKFPDFRAVDKSPTRNTRNPHKADFVVNITLMIPEIQRQNHQELKAFPVIPEKGALPVHSTQRLTP